MTKVMKARLAAGTTLAMQTCMLPDLFECSFELEDGDLVRIAIEEKGIIMTRRVSNDFAPPSIFAKELTRVGANWNESGLEEL